MVRSRGSPSVGSSGLPSVPSCAANVSPRMRNCLVWLSSPIHRSMVSVPSMRSAMN
ncbi:hypothetical protein SHIRM173S_08178 [Streptomyces hirsutus]